MINFQFLNFFLEKNSKKNHLAASALTVAFFIVVFFHFFTWSFPFPSDLEASAYIQSANSDSIYVVKTILFRFIDHFFTFGYAKSAFVSLGILTLILIYVLFNRVGNKNIAAVISLIFGLNSYLFTIWHKANAIFFIFLCFLACLYILINFISHWKEDLKKSAYKALLFLIIFLLILLNSEAYILPFALSVLFMIFILFLRLYNVRTALSLTLFTFVIICFFQYLIDQRVLFNLFLLEKYNDTDAGIVSKLEYLYFDNYQSSLWQIIHKRLDFFDLKNCISKRNEFFLLCFIGLASLFFIARRFFELLSRLEDKKAVLHLIYNPSSLLVTISLSLFSISSVVMFAFHIYSEQLFSYWIFSLILFAGASFIFLSTFDKQKLYGSFNKENIHDIIYRPFFITSALILVFYSAFNIYTYVLPFRGSNYPTLHDAIAKVWKSSGCSELGYSSPLLSLILNDLNKSAGSYSDLIEDISNGKVNKNGCVVLPLVARNHAYNYQHSDQAEIEATDLYLGKNYEISARVLLPFYQMDPAYPFNELDNSKIRDFKKPYGHPIYGFGGMQDIVIYKPLAK
jgi:hypothetical protein